MELHNGRFLFRSRNRETVAAMMEANDANALKRYPSFRELRDQI